MLDKVWEKLEHHISTGFGVFGHIIQQYSVEALVWHRSRGFSSPILWALLNQLILTALEEKYDCITLVSVDKSTTSMRPGDSFVDDTATGTTDDDVTKELVPTQKKGLLSEEDAMVKRTEDIIQFFIDLPQVTVGT
jgi:hypothetical protein